MNHKRDRLEALARELDARLQDLPPVTLSMAPLELLALISAAQLGMRHPDFPEGLWRHLATSIGRIRREVPPELGACIGQGDRGAMIPAPGASP